MIWRNNWDPLEMVACISPETTIGPIGLRVSKTIFMFVFELSESEQEILNISKKYLAYVENAAIESYTQPYFFAVNFGKLNGIAYNSKRVWWTTFETFPDINKSFPAGVRPSEVHLMDTGY